MLREEDLAWLGRSWAELNSSAWQNPREVLKRRSLPIGRENKRSPNCRGMLRVSRAGAADQREKDVC